MPEQKSGAVRALPTGNEIDELDFADLNQFDTSGTAVLELLQPDGVTPLVTKSGKPVTMTLYGADSEVFRTAQREIVNERATKAARAKKVDPLLVQDDMMRIYARCCAAWFGFSVGGEVIPCLADNVYNVLKKYPFIYEQVQAFVGERANFIPKSSKP